MAEIEIINEAAGRPNKDFVREVVRKTVRLSGIKVKKASLSVIFASRTKIRSLNRKYRGRNKSTDVLSFNYSSGYNKEKVEGELFLCPKMIEKSAKKHEVSFRKELAFVLSHGVLHLLGMRHGKKMYGIQDEVVRKLRIKNG